MAMTMTDAEQLLDKAFAPWVKALNLSITEFSESGAVLEMPITENLVRVGGIVSGQALAAMADTAMVLASIGHLQAPTPVATTNLDTQFLRPAAGDLVRCEAEVVRAGKALIFARATMTAFPMNKPVATATATFYIP